MSPPANRARYRPAFIVTTVALLTAVSCGHTESGTLVPGAGGQGQAGSGLSTGGSGEGGATVETCGCLLGDGPYCEGRASAEAAAAECQLPELPGAEGALLKCESDEWSVLELCAQSCNYTPESSP